MNKYLCLLYYDAPKFDTLGPSDFASLIEECKPHDAALRESGQVRATASLVHETTVTIRARDGERTTTDRPVVDANERVGAFLLIDARDLNDAIRIASKHPAAQTGEHLGWAVEIRPIRTFVES